RDRIEAAPLARELRRRGVPSVYRGRESVYATAEACDLHRLLAAVLEPRSARLVRAALASALLERSAAELEQMLGDDAGLLRWQDRFALWRERARRHGVQALLRGILFELEVPARVLAGADGERRLTDCLHLIELLGAERAELEDDEALLVRFGEQIDGADG